MAFSKIARRFILVPFLLFAACSQTADENAAATSSGGITQQAAVAIPDPYAAEIAVRILKQGGNAVDAA